MKNLYTVSVFVIAAMALSCVSCGNRINSSDSLAEEQEQGAPTNEEKIQVLIEHFEKDFVNRAIHDVDSVKVEIIKPQMVVTFHRAKYPQSWNNVASEDYVEAERRKWTRSLRLWSHNFQPAYESTPQYQSLVALAEEGMTIRIVLTALDGTTIEFGIDPNLVISNEDI